MVQHKSSALLAAAILSIAAIPAAYANIFLDINPVPINPTLSANGWSGYVLTFVSDTPGENPAAFNLVETTPLYNGTPGINGPIHQAWTVYPTTGAASAHATPTGDSLPADIAARTDSMFRLPSTSFAPLYPFLVNNNLQNGPNSNPPFIQSPLA